MQKSRLVRSFLTYNDKILILKRSEKVRSMKGLWSGISGIIENDEEPLSRAKIEIFEEVGINEEQIKLINSSKGMLVDSPQYKNHQWVFFPFLFETDKIDIKLNWENSEFRWIHVDQLKEFSIVPSLEKVLSTLL